MALLGQKKIVETRIFFQIVCWKVHFTMVYVVFSKKKSR